MSKKHLLLASSLLTAVLAGTQVRAQEPVAPDDDAVAEVIVTGTRLRLPDYTSPNPVTSVSGAQIQARGETNLTDFLLDMPALAGSFENAQGADSGSPGKAGLNLLNLRNLGTERTLVLVNGRRHVAGNPGTASVDINTIPIDLVQRVDVLTGGASAVYGADGVSGVVNFILKDNFEGISARFQTGLGSGGTAGATTFGSIVMGRNFMDGRGNATLALDASNQNDLKFYDREYTRSGQRPNLVRNPADIPDRPDLYDRILVTDARYLDSSTRGSVYTRYDGNNFTDLDFLGDGSPFIPGQRTSGFIVIGGSGTRLDEYNDDLLSGADRFSADFLGRFDLTSRISLFTELKATQTFTDLEGQPSYDYALYIPLDNPYIPAVIRQSVIEGMNAVDEFGDPAPDDAAGAEGLPPGVLVARDNFDIGKKQNDLRRDTFRAVLGARGALTENIDYEVSYVYGQSRQKLGSSNIRINERFFAATDAVRAPSGQIVCRSNLDPGAVPVGDIYAQFPFDQSTFGSTFTPGANSGCIPINIFGEGNATPEAIDWVTTDIEDRAKITQQVVTAYLRGDSEPFFKLPGGPIRYVVGGEYRREASLYEPDPVAILSETLQYPITESGRASVTRGAFEVKEAFAEISLPLLRDVRFIKELTVGGAYRYSDYSSSGASETWNVNARWAPHSAVAFRGTKARAVRAANIDDLYAGRQQTFTQVADPCDIDNRSLGENPTLRSSQCLTALAALGLPGGGVGFTNTSSDETGGFISGNPNLQPETADTITYGVVFTPPFIPGLSLSIDRYEIDIEDAIASYSAQTIINNCYDTPQPNQFCSLFSRVATPGQQQGYIADFLQVPANVARFNTRGYDITARYRVIPSRFGIEADIGTFDISFIASILRNLTETASQTAAPVELRNTDYTPKRQYTLDVSWERGSWGASYAFAYASPTEFISQTTRLAQPDYMDPRYFDYEPRKEHDVQVRYEFNDSVQVYSGVNNLFDQRPEIQDFIYPVSPLGRYLYVGFRYTR